MDLGSRILVYMEEVLISTLASIKRWEGVGSEVVSKNRCVHPVTDH